MSLSLARSHQHCHHRGSQNTGGPFDFQSDDILARQGYGLMAAALMAIDHFNARNDSVVPELNTTTTTTSQCTFTFPPELFQVFDSHRDASSTFIGLANVQEHCFVVGPMVTAEAQILSVALNAYDIPGIAYGSHISKCFSCRAISHASVVLLELSSTRLLMTGTRGTDTQSILSQLVRASVDPLDYIAALVDFLKDENREYVAVLSNYRDSREDFQLEFEAVSMQSGLQIQSLNIVNGNNLQQGIGNALDAINENGFRTIVVALYDDSFLETIASEADNRGMLSDQFWWIFLDITIPPQYLYKYSYKEGSAIDRMLRGSVIFKLLDGFDWNPYDRFLPAWRSLNATFVERLNSLYPNSTTYQFRGEGDFFRTEMPPAAASFIYDAVVAAGLAKCQVEAANLGPGISGPPGFGPFGPPPGFAGFPNGTGFAPPGGSGFQPPSGSGFSPPGGAGFSPPGGAGFSPPGSGSTNGTLAPPNNGVVGPGPFPGSLLPSTNDSRYPIPTGQGPFPSTASNTTTWLKSILNISFHGASGFMSFIPSLSVRDPNTVVFGIFNIQANGLNASTSGVQYEAVLTNVRISGQWQTTNLPYIFRDGTSNVPEPNRVISNHNYIPRGVRVVGIMFMAVAQVLCVACGIFVWAYRSDRILTASQPEFMYVLCFGSFLFSASILTRSFDESVGLSTRQLDGLCMATPWLVSLGDSIIYLSLFSKVCRIVNMSYVPCAS